MELDKSDVFAQGLKSPECVKLLFNCFQNLETEMKNVKEIPLTTKEWQIKGTEQLNEMNSAITFINKKFAEFEKEIKNNEEIKSLRKENSYLTKRLEEMDAILDRKEQYSRRNCLLIHGVDEVEGEDTNELSTKVMKEHMNQKIKPEDIDRSHRLGNPKKYIKAKPQPIIMKYVRYNTRNIIYRNKKILKGKGTSVTNFLTSKRIKMLEKARELHGFVNVWSQDIKIMFFDKTIDKVNVFYN